MTNVPKRAQYEFNDPQVGQEIDLQINSKTVGTIVALGTDLPSTTNSVDLTTTNTLAAGDYVQVGSDFYMAQNELDLSVQRSILLLLIISLRSVLMLMSPQFL